MSLCMMQKMSFLQLPVLDVAAVGAVVDGLPQQTHPMVQQSARRERGAIGTLDGEIKKGGGFLCNATPGFKVTISNL